MAAEIATPQVQEDQYVIDWKEYNPEFGDHALRKPTTAETNNDDHDFHHLEFDFENLETTITLREKSKISHSTGLALWTCSQILGSYLTDHPELVKDQRVLELGAGLGLCGVVAHHLDAHHVLVTDGDTDVLHNLQHNMKLNHREDSSESNLSCTQLVWGRDLHNFRRHPVILATDVLYSPQNIEPLWQTVDNLLEPDGLFLLAFAPHNVTIDQVLDKAEQLGFTWTCPNISESTQHEDDEEKLEEDHFFSSSEYGYYVFHFQRIQQ